MQNNLTANDILAILKKDGLDGLFRTFKIGLSKADRDKMAEKIKQLVLENINYGRPLSVPTYGDLPKNGANGIYIVDNDGHWYYWVESEKRWVDGGLFEDSTALAEKQNYKAVNWTPMPASITNKNQFYKEVSKVFATASQSIYMFGTPEELDPFWNIWGKPDGLKATHVYIAIKSISNTSSRHSFIVWVFSSNYANPYFRIISGYNGTYVSVEDKGWVNVNNLTNPTGIQATDLLDLVVVEGDGIVWDISEDNQHIHFHLDNNVDVETELAVKRFSNNNQVCTLDGAYVNTLKGLRAWVKLPYNGNVLVKCQEIRFPTVRNYQYYISNPIPNPQIFSEQIILQYDNETNELRLNSTGSSISADIQMLEVRGVK